MSKVPVSRVVVFVLVLLAFAGFAGAQLDPLTCVPVGQFDLPPRAPDPTRLDTGLPRAVHEGATPANLDPERPANDAYGSAMDGVGFEVTDDLEPSIHVMRRSFEPGLDEAALLRSLSKSTRQRIRAAEQAGVNVGMIAADISCLLQSAHTPKARRG